MQVWNTLKTLNDDWWSLINNLSPVQNCIPPPNPSNQPPARVRPDIYQIWNDSRHWTDSGNGTYTASVNGDGASTIPPDYQDIYIKRGMWNARFCGGCMNFSITVPRSVDDREAWSSKDKYINHRWCFGVWMGWSFTYRDVECNSRNYQGKSVR